MRKYGGVLVHCSRDEEGLVEVVDAHGVRSLHFGTPPRQSAMSLDEPDRLELSYLRAMLVGLLFKPQPRRVLVLGLGGGSLVRFLFRHFPDCLIEAVESRAEVAAVAHRFFGLPNDPRIIVHLTDGCEFLAEHPGTQDMTYDHILVDIFDHEGLAASATDRSFFAAAARCLRSDGVLAMNLWGSCPDSCRQSLDGLKSYFGERVARLPVIGRGNIIAFGLGPEAGRLASDTLRERAWVFEQRLNVEFPRLLHSLSKSSYL